jgi:carbon monoxide dehydrogenase subunit G
LKLEGSHVLPGTPDRLWDFLLDPEVRAGIMPGCKSLTLVGDDEYEGLIEARIGPIASKYTTRFKVRDKVFPTSYRLVLEGSGPGGFVNSDTTISLESLGEKETVMRYDGEAMVGGTIARVGQRLVEAAAKVLIEQGFKALQKDVSARIQA